MKFMYVSILQKLTRSTYEEKLVDLKLLTSYSSTTLFHELFEVFSLNTFTAATTTKTWSYQHMLSHQHS